jgi:predicted secreted hydrolase
MKRTVFVLLMILATGGRGAGDQVWRSAAPGYAWEFPRDLAAHPDYKTEWWYVTGHLDPEDGPALGFQLTFFRVGLQQNPPAAAGSNWAAGDLIMAHAAVTDPEGEGHVFSEATWRAVPLLGGFGAPGDSTLAWCRAPTGTDDIWRITYVDGSLRLRARDDRRGLRFELDCRPTRGPVFHGNDGYSPKTADRKTGSLYFSQTRMKTEGTVYRNGRPVPVTGDSWLDREIFTDTLADDQTGWDWFALQFEDGRDIMLYRLRNDQGGESFALGTLVDADGTTTALSGDAWSLEASATWTSPETGSEYPVRWRLRVPAANLDLELQAVIPEQENVSSRTGIHYWEGAVTAKPFGEKNSGWIGRGFVELTGYGVGSRPPV